MKSPFVVMAISGLVLAAAPGPAPFTPAPRGGSGGAGEPPQLDRGAGFTSAPREDYEPNVFIYDNYPGGIGLSEPLYRLHSRLLAESRSLIAA